MRGLRELVVAPIVLTACAPTTPSPTAMPAAAGTTSVAPAPPAMPSPIGKTARIPGGAFRMGSEVGEPDEMPVHEAHVAPFTMDLTEVTVHQYAECARAGACPPATTVVQWPGVTAEDEELAKDVCNGDRPDRQDHAVNCVDWTMADAYCRWAGKRLPTEEEWEYAACAGDCSDVMKGRLGRAVTRGAARWPSTTRVASRLPGAFGLYDMAGNVWEWTASAYCPYDHPGCSDPRRVIRGGSWSMVDYLFVRLSDRSPGEPSTRNANVGFRCAGSGER